VLALPEGRPIVCRAPDADPAHPLPPQAVVREFRFGPPNEARISWSREINVAFDSTGRALLLLDEASFGIRGGETVFALDSAGRLTGMRIDVTVDSAAQDRAVAQRDMAGTRAAVRPPVTRPLTPEENKQLSTLVGWLWKSRCNK
jgi:hypothetical protein